MAKIEFHHPATEHFPAFTETIEVRVWGLGGTADMPFYIGSGLNFQAHGNLWLEIIYSVEGAQIFYTRNFLHHLPDLIGKAPPPSRLKKRLEKIVAMGEGTFGFGDILPETSLQLILRKFTYEDENEQKQQSTAYSLKISADTGSVFGRSAPGDRSVDIQMQLSDHAEGVRFMHELIDEIAAVRRGKHPDPANFPPGSSEWPFIDQLNRQAYARISETYQEAYFDNPLLAEAFDGWLAQLPPGGSVLDAGCGHGDPVIGRLLEKGFQVTGSDFSPEMLRRAGEKFPQASFLQAATTTIAEQAAFDGICSFNSLLYLDPIDLLNSIYRLHQALKPGGLLFLFAFDSGPDWRGEPFSHRVGQWMWSWHYGMEEAARLLEEHGYFKVLGMHKVQVDEGEAERRAQEFEKYRQQEEEFRLRQENASDDDFFPFRYPRFHFERSPYTYVITARKTKKAARA